MGQIGRYLNGQAFSNDAMTQLESHIQECEDCKVFLVARREALQTILTQNPVVVANVPISETTAQAPTKDQVVSINADPQLMAEVAAQLQQSTPKASISPNRILKPSLYAGALAIVLIGMNFASRQITSMSETRGIGNGTRIVTANNPASTPATTPGVAQANAANANTNANPAPATPVNQVAQAQTNPNNPVGANPQPQATPSTQTVSNPAPANTTPVAANNAATDQSAAHQEPTPSAPVRQPAPIRQAPAQIVPSSRINKPATEPKPAKEVVRAEREVAPRPRIKKRIRTARLERTRRQPTKVARTSKPTTKKQDSNFVRIAPVTVYQGDN